MSEHQATVESGQGAHTAGTLSPETPAASAAEAQAEPLFGREDLAQFDKDDRDAGAAIGKMLSLFFFYTVVVMSLVAWWTFKVSSP